MEKNLIYGIGLLLGLSLFPLVLHAERYSEPGAGFSYEVLDGWQLVDFPGMKYKAMIGQRENGFSPNLNFVDETTKVDMSLDEYASANETTLEKVFVNYKKISRTDFATDSRLKSIKLITESDQQKNHLRQTFYFFKRTNQRFIVVTCSTLASNGDALAPEFDKELKTFDLSK